MSGSSSITLRTSSRGNLVRLRANAGGLDRAARSMAAGWVLVIESD